MQFKTRIFVISFIMLMISSKSFSQNTDFAVSYGCSQTDFLHELIIDEDGNNYTIGGFYDTLYYDSLYLSTENYLDMYIMKRNSMGEILWVSNYGGPVWDMAIDICFSPGQEYLYVTGFFEHFVDFDDIHLDSYGTIDIFLLKMNTEGEVIWAKNAGGSLYDYGYGIGTDQSGNVYLTGKFESLAATFDDHTIYSVNNAADNYLAKYNPEGELIWVKGSGGYGWDSSNDLAISSSGDIYICGEYNLEATFDTVQVSGSYGDIFIARYNQEGNIVDVYTVGGIGTSEVYSIAIDQSDHIYITGLFTVQITFGSQVLYSLGDEDFYLLKMDPEGNFMWAKNAGGNMFNCGYDVLVGPNGIVYCTGAIVGNAYFDDTLVSSNGFSDTFLAAYDNDGSLINIQTFGGDDDVYGDDGRAISWWNGNVILGGRFTEEILINNTQLVSFGERDIFLCSIPEVVTGTIHQMVKNNEISIFPNPAKTSVKINLKTEMDGSFEISLYSIYGELVFHEEILINHIDEIEIPLISAHNGIYQLTIIHNNRIVFSNKLIRFK